MTCNKCLGVYSQEEADRVADSFVNEEYYDLCFPCAEQLWKESETNQQDCDHEARFIGNPEQHS